MNKFIVTVSLLISSVAIADAQWWVCKQSYNGKTRRANYCTSAEETHSVNASFCNELPNGKAFDACRKRVDANESDPMFGGPIPMCRRTHSTCIE